MSTLNKMLETALRCLEKGWFVFPLGEKSKTPDGELAPNGFNSASNDPEVVRAWWTKKPNANIGIDLGRSSLTVLDFDNGAPPPELGLPNTLHVSTSRGTHVYLSGVSKQGDMYVNGVHVGEIKSAGGYVLAPFSLHPSGSLYSVAVTAPVAPVPEGLIQRLRPERKTVDANLSGEKIPRGQHDKTLFRIGCKLRALGGEEDGIYNFLVEVCEKRCENYGSDYLGMCRRKAQQACKYAVGVDGSIELNQSAQTADVSDWRELFRSVGEMEDGPIDMIIDGVLQEGTCFIGANPGDGKTLVGLAFAKAICTGEPLFGLPQFPVKKPRTTIYLIPESRDRAFRKRCEAFQLPDDKMKFMARTISAGVSLELSDPRLLEAVRETKAVVFLDTASRFMKGSDENAAAQNRQLVNDVIALLAAGAVCVILVHHATKAAKTNQERMTLENMLRGTSDFGAMCDQAYGVRKDMNLYANGGGPMEIELVSLKDREQIGGLTSIRLAASRKAKGEAFPASYINETGNFRVVSDSETNRREVQALETAVKNEPNIPAKELAVSFNMTEYRVKTQLAKLGWHRVQGGSVGASPWHQDLSGPCPYEKVVEMKPKTTVEDAVAYLQKALAGTSPDGDFVPEADILTGADQTGISDASIGKARKRLGVVVTKEGSTVAWSLPGQEEAAAS